MLLDDAENSGQAEPGPFARLFGGKKRFKDAWEDLRRNPAPSVSNPKTNVSPGRGVWDESSVLFGENFLGRLDQKLAAAGHGVTSIDQQVHQHLVEHPSVDPGGERVRMDRELQVHVFPQDALQHFGQADHRLVQVDLAGLQHLLATEGQQPLGQAGSPFGRRLQIIKQMLNFVRHILCRACQMDLHHHGTQECC
jgi:hypothetical protein